jgi:hypothetical protein
MWCFFAWCVAVTAVIAVALMHGVQPSILFNRVHKGGRVDPWQALFFSVSMSAFGFWIALTTKPRRIPEDPAALAFHLMRFARNGGWIFAVGGIIAALRAIGLLQTQ